MKIVVSVHELSTETQLIIENMRRSKAPVLIGDPNKPTAVLLSLEEYDRLLRESQKNTAAEAMAASRGAAADTSRPAADISRPAADIAQPAPEAPSQPARIEPAPGPTAAKSASAEVVPAAQHSDVAQRAAATIQADRATSPDPAFAGQPPVVSQRQNTMQPDPGLATMKRVQEPPRAPRLTKPLPKPPRPLGTPRAPRPRPQINLSSVLSAIPGGWQTIALVAGMLVLGIVGFALIVSAFNG